VWLRGGPVKVNWSRSMKCQRSDSLTVIRGSGLLLVTLVHCMLWWYQLVSVPHPTSATARSAQPTIMTAFKHYIVSHKILSQYTLDTVHELCRCQRKYNKNIIIVTLTITITTMLLQVCKLLTVQCVVNSYTSLNLVYFYKNTSIYTQSKEQQHCSLCQYKTLQ